MAGKPHFISDYGSALADRVRTTREARGMSYTDLSRAISYRDINPVGIRRIENHERRVDIDDAFALAQALGVSIVELLGVSTDKQPSGGSVRRLRDAAQSVLDELS